MTKPQIWIAIFLGIFILLFMIGRLTKDESISSGPESNPMPQSDFSSEDLSARDLIGRLGCVTCHGQDLQGTQMGPSLHEVSDHWKRDNLINYLRNPSSYMSNARVKAFKEKYPSVIMPPYSHVDVKELGKIAEYLLAL